MEQSLILERSKTTEERPLLIKGAFRYRCRECRHPKILHESGSCSQCACVVKRTVKTKPFKREDAYAAIVEGAKYYPTGISLTKLIYIVSLHNKEVYTYFEMARYGRRVWGIYPASPYQNIGNMRYYRFRQAILDGKVAELRVKAGSRLGPRLRVYYAGEGFS